MKLLASKPLLPRSSLRDLILRHRADFASRYEGDLELRPRTHLDN